MNRILSIDPSGTGTTGIFFANKNEQEFQEFTHKNWKEHLLFIISLIKEKNPNLIVYENTNYVNLKGVDMTSLFKLFGALETLTNFFTLEINNVPVDQVKRLKSKLITEQEIIKGLSYEIGRGKGWKWENKKINIHQLDALLVYLIWSKK